MSIYSVVRDNLVSIEMIKDHRMPSGKAKVHSVSARHYDARLRKALDIFRKGPELVLYPLIFSDFSRFVQKGFLRPL